MYIIIKIVYKLCTKTVKTFVKMVIFKTFNLFYLFYIHVLLLNYRIVNSSDLIQHILTIAKCSKIKSYEIKCRNYYRKTTRN